MPIYYEGREWVPSDKTSIRQMARVLLGSAASSLFFTVLSTALAQYGIISIGLARLFLIVAWLIAWIGTWVSDNLWHKPKRHIAIVTITTALIVGALFLCLDSYAMKQRAESEAAAKQSPPVYNTSPPAPPVPITKTPPIPRRGMVGGNVNPAPCSNTATGGVGTTQSITNCTVNPDPKQSVVTWFLNGEQRITSPGHITGALGERTAYEQMLDLTNKKQWKDLFDLAKAENSKAPDWVTPYYYMGIAYGSTGQLDSAIKAFKYVEEHASGNSDYGNLADKAKEFREMAERKLELSRQ